MLLVSTIALASCSSVADGVGDSAETEEPGVAAIEGERVGEGVEENEAVVASQHERFVADVSDCDPARLPGHDAQAATATLLRNYREFRNENVWTLSSSALRDSVEANTSSDLVAIRKTGGLLTSVSGNTATTEMVTVPRLVIDAFLEDPTASSELPLIAVGLILENGEWIHISAIGAPIEKSKPGHLRFVSLCDRTNTSAWWNSLAGQVPTNDGRLDQQSLAKIANGVIDLVQGES